MLSSGLLGSSWSKISELQNSSYQNRDSGFKIYQEDKITFVVFAAPPISRNGSYTLVPDPKSQASNPFQFLCSEKTPSFALHTPAFELFSTAYDNIYNRIWEVNYFYSKPGLSDFKSKVNTNSKW